MDVSVGDGRDTGLFTKVVLGSLVLGRDRERGAKCAAAANKPVNRSGGQRLFHVQRFWPPPGYLGRSSPILPNVKLSARIDLEMH